MFVLYGTMNDLSVFQHFVTCNLYDNGREAELKSPHLCFSHPIFLKGIDLKVLTVSACKTVAGSLYHN